jgi:hypothetical protein
VNAGMRPTTRRVISETDLFSWEQESGSVPIVFHMIIFGLKRRYLAEFLECDRREEKGVESVVLSVSSKQGKDGG